jgi:hypothetical protein
MTYSAWDREIREIERERIAGMAFPARCDCGQLYDLGKVEVTARYADCSIWKTPCCDRQTDDRPKGWRCGPNYVELGR